MIDLTTLMFSVLVVTALLAILMILSGRSHTNYPGYILWSVSLVVLASAHMLLILREVIPFAVSVIAGNCLIILGLLLMTESLYRFYEATPLWKGYYLTLLPFGMLIAIFTLLIDNISIRVLIFSAFTITISMVIIWMISTHTPGKDDISRLTIVFFLLFSLVLGIRAADWIIHPVGKNLFETGSLNIGIYFFDLITIVSLTFLFLFMNYQRYSRDLRDAHALTAGLMEDLDQRNRDLEKVSIRLLTHNKELDYNVQERTKKIESLLF
ncbi:MAG TPA: hypothetical protein VN372_04440 [Methanospirillum sp.]|nr:hypothetical protein [Methanospirillum sp.]